MRPIRSETCVLRKETKIREHCDTKPKRQRNGTTVCLLDMRPVFAMPTRNEFGPQCVHTWVRAQTKPNQPTKQTNKQTHDRKADRGIQGGFCRHKHRYKNTDPETMPGGQESLLETLRETTKHRENPQKLRDPAQT